MSIEALIQDFIFHDQYRTTLSTVSICLRVVFKCSQYVNFKIFLLLLLLFIIIIMIIIILLTYYSHQDNKYSILAA